MVKEMEKEKKIEKTQKSIDKREQKMGKLKNIILMGK